VAFNEAYTWQATGNMGSSCAAAVAAMARPENSKAGSSQDIKGTIVHTRHQRHHRTYKTSKALAKTFHALTMEGTAELVRSSAAVSLVCALVCVAAPSLST
jgi:hypothetical protein